MTSTIVSAHDRSTWRAALACIGRLDVCHLPEYHLAYVGRTPGSKAVMWTYDEGEYSFRYPFLITEALIAGPDGVDEPTGFVDISSVYGYSGPLSSSTDPTFLRAAWSAFDEWSANAKVIVEFVRFSEYAENHTLAHPKCLVDCNRPTAVTRRSQIDASFFDSLGSKTRNMIRRAERSGAMACELDPCESLASFKRLYASTMVRNSAPQFFDYSDSYYALLCDTPPGEMRMFGARLNGELESAAIVLSHKGCALYHLGASSELARHTGAANLVLYEMCRHLLDTNIEFINFGGGRTTSGTDPLFTFKRRNAIETGVFRVGRRVINEGAYSELRKRWQAKNPCLMPSSNLIFYR